MSKECWLRTGCPSRMGSCYSCGPDDDGCPVYRWFREKFVVRCKDCKYGRPMRNFKGELMIDCLNGDNWLKCLDWYCADGEHK